MSIWGKLTRWAGKDKNTPPPIPESRTPNAGPSYERQFVSPTRKYKNVKWRAAARALHRHNRRERLKDPVATHRQKLRKLGLS